MKSFIESQFGYCSLIWMYHSRRLNNKINRLHERALRIVHRDYDNTFEELLSLDNSHTIYQRNLQKLAIEMYKVLNDLSPRFMKKLFPFSTNNYNLRHKKIFKTENIRTVHYGIETISYWGPKIWESLPCDIKYSDNLQIFKKKIKSWKPVGCNCNIFKTYIHHVGFL